MMIDPDVNLGLIVALVGRWMEFGDSLYYPYSQLLVKSHC